MRLRRIIRWAIQIRRSKRGIAILWMLILVFFFRALITGIDDFQAVRASFELDVLVLSLTIVLFRSFLMPVKWYYVLRTGGSRLQYTTVGKIFYFSQLSSYIPGGVWQYLDLGYRTTKEGETASDVVHSIVFVQGVAVASALIYGAAMFGIFRPDYAIGSLLLILLLVGGTLCSSRILDHLKQVVPYLKAEFDSYEMTSRSLSILLLLSLSLWILDGLFLYTLVNAIFPTPLHLFVPISGVMAVSWAAGFLVFVLPGGLGIREGVMAYLLSQLMPLSLAIGVSVLSRILFLVAEAMMAITFSVLHNESEPKSNPSKV